jgi:hypothetical protein
MNMATGEVVPARCGRNRCAYCLPLNARRRAEAMRWAGVRRSITITEVADRDAATEDAWQQARRKVNRVREYLLRKSVDPGSWGYFVERGAESGMVHVHVGQNGKNAVPKGALQEAAHRAGAGWTRVESIRQGKGFSQYVGKGFSAYVGKGFTAEDGQENLHLNGGRLGHFSRGFFGTVKGQTLGVREAEKLAAEALREGEAGRWVLVRE